MIINYQLYMKKTLYTNNFYQYETQFDYSQTQWFSYYFGVPEH